MDPISCTAIVNFNVPKKNNPPPVNLTATVWILKHELPSGVLEKYAIEWTDPSGTLAPPSVPVNTWVQAERIFFHGHVGDSVMSHKFRPPRTTRAGDAIFLCLWCRVFGVQYYFPFF